MDATAEILRVYKSKVFARFARKARIGDIDLWRAASLANDGVIDSVLGGGVIKQRIARKGQGKSGGSRAVILFAADVRAVYVYGFEKKDMANIRPDELEAFRELAKVVLSYSETEITRRVSDGALVEVKAPTEESDA